MVWDSVEITCNGSVGEPREIQPGAQEMETDSDLNLLTC